MHDCYVTTTLLNSWLFYLKSREEWEEKAHTDFLNCLNKVKTEPTEAMQRGIEFEDMVRLYDGKQLYSRKDDTVNEIVDYISGGLWQQTVTKTIEVNGLKVLVYGKADVIEKDTIYDIKRVKHYEIGKYGHSVQHKLYLFCTGLPIFKYLVSDGQSVFVETYTFYKNLNADVQALIVEFFEWLQKVDLFETYFEKWKGEDKA